MGDARANGPIQKGITKIRGVLTKSAEGSDGDRYFKAYLNDPVARLLLDKLHWTPFLLGLSVFLFNLAANTVFAHLAGVFEPPPPVPGVLQDWPNSIFFDLIVTPVSMGFYLWTAIAVSDVFREIEKTNIIKPTPATGIAVTSEGQDCDSLVKEGASSPRALFNRWYWLVLTILVVTLVAAHRSNAQLRALSGDSWIALNWANYNSLYYLVFKLVPGILEWYMLCMLVARQIGLIVGLRNLFRDRQINLYPLHPDKCGGLYPISRYSITFSYLIAVIGLEISRRVITGYMSGGLWGDYSILIATFAYFSLGPIYFFAPLGTAHAAMKKAKEKWLNEIATQFMRDYQTTHRQLDQTAQELKDEFDKLDSLEKLYRLTDNFPVWPFDTQTLRRFFATIMTPVVPAIITLIFELIKQRLPSLLQ